MRVEVYGCRNGMCMNPVYILVQVPRYILEDLVRIFQNTLKLVEKYGLFLCSDKSIITYCYFPVITLADEAKFAIIIKEIADTLTEK